MNYRQFILEKATKANKTQGPANDQLPQVQANPSLPENSSSKKKMVGGSEQVKIQQAQSLELHREQLQQILKQKQNMMLHPLPEQQQYAQAQPYLPQPEPSVQNFGLNNNRSPPRQSEKPEPKAESQLKEFEMVPNPMDKLEKYRQQVSRKSNNSSQVENSGNQRQMNEQSAMPHLIDDENHFYSNKWTCKRILRIIVLVTLMLSSTALLVLYFTVDRTNFCETGLAPNQGEECVRCPRNGMCAEGSLKCNQGYVRVGNACELRYSIQSHTKAIILEILNQIEQKNGEMLCVNYFAASKPMQYDLSKFLSLTKQYFQQPIEEILNQHLKNHTEPEERLIIRKSILDYFYDAAAQKAHNFKITQLYLSDSTTLKEVIFSMNYQLSLTCKLQYMVLKNLSSIALTAMILATIGYFVFSLNKYRNTLKFAKVLIQSLDEQIQLKAQVNVEEFKESSKQLLGRNFSDDVWNKFLQYRKKQGRIYLFQDERGKYWTVTDSN